MRASSPCRKRRPEATPGGSVARNGEGFFGTGSSIGTAVRSTETIEGVTITHDYRYDDAGRLEEVLRDGTRVAFYTYDPNGNRKTAELPTETITADYDAQDRLERYGSNVYTYRDSGELLTKTVSGAQTTYDYDELGNLLSVALPGNSVVEYEIDSLNRRVGRKFDGQVTHRWLYKDQLNPLAELDEDGNLVALFIYGTRAHVPDAMVKDGTRYLFVTDLVGSVRLVVNAETGAVVQRMDYDAWGNVTLDNNSGFQPFGFAGGLYDRDTKLVRFGARDYDPEVGRWTAKDPILFEGGQSNIYSYVGDDPVNFLDAEGKGRIGLGAFAACVLADAYSIYKLFDALEEKAAKIGPIDTEILECDLSTIEGLKKREDLLLERAKLLEELNPPIADYITSTAVTSTLCVGAAAVAFGTPF
jgi:RHS repeat-associated protein